MRNKCFLKKLSRLLKKINTKCAQTDTVKIQKLVIQIQIFQLKFVQNQIYPKPAIHYIFVSTDSISNFSRNSDKLIL